MKVIVLIVTMKFKGIKKIHRMEKDSDDQNVYFAL